MEMKIIKSEKRICPCCMEEHVVKTVLIMDQATFKNRTVNYEASYFFCELAKELYMDEQQMQDNDIRLKDAYREKEGLLTSAQIGEIRAKYGISQSDLCLLLGWGGKTITRYESHQVQDKAHDAKFQGNQMFHGNTDLSLDKVVEVIRYFASSIKVTSLYKVKLMKLIWYADALSYKRRGFAITGLVYQVLPMGAVPVGHNSIIDLKDVPCEEVDMGETYAYHFSLSGKQTFPELSDEEKDILDVVIEKFGKMSKNEIINFMHKEQAYVETLSRDIILFKYAESLQI